VKADFESSSPPEAGNRRPRALVSRRNTTVTSETSHPRRRWILRGVAIAIVGVVLTAIACIAIVFSLYVQTEDADAASAAREFDAARARLAGQEPLLEFRGLDPPVVHVRQGPRRPLTTVHMLIYDATEEYVRRVDVPVRMIRLATLGGRIRLMSLAGLDGNRDDDRLTLDDLERHGPGLVLDTSGGAIGPLIVGDAVAGTRARESLLLIWTE
jgi:hypothetical protein